MNVPYKNTNRFVARFPLFPLSVIQKAFNDDDFYKKIIKSKSFQDALFFSTPELYQELVKCLNNRQISKRENRIHVSLLKYLSRMSTRCTPFAFFAGCSIGEIASKTSMVLRREVECHFRFDMMFLCMLSQLIQKDADFKTVFKIKTNSTLYRVGRKFRYVNYINGRNGRIFRLEETKVTPILTYILNHCSDYIEVNILRNSILKNFEVQQEEVDIYIKSLIDNQILIEEIDPFVIGHDYFDYLLGKIRGKATSWYRFCGLLDEKLKLLNNGKNVDYKAVCKEMEDVISNKGISYNCKYLVQLDTFRRSREMTLSSDIIEQLKDCLVLFLCLDVRHGKNADLENFKNNFSNRYETQEIPLLEALDTDIGIGYGMQTSKLYNSLTEDLVLPKSHRHNVSLQEVLLNQLFQSDVLNEIILREDFVQQMKQHISWESFPPSLSAIFQVAYLEDSDMPQIVNLCFSGCSAANLLSRFAYCDKKMEDLVKEIVNEEQKINNDIVFAEIAHIPNDRVGNILFRPLIRDYEIDYLSNADRSKEQVIELKDLMVSVKGNKVFLKAKNLNKYVVPRLTNAHNFHKNTTPAYRFLCDVQHQQSLYSLAFSWGALGNMPFLPRIRYKNIILSLAKWNFKKSDLVLMQGDKVDSVKRWRAKFGLPRFINLTEGDNKLFVDLEKEKSVYMFLDEIKNKERFVVEEFFGCGMASKDVHGEYYMNECIVPFIKQVPTNYGNDKA